jgi:hypothetical protein
MDVDQHLAAFVDAFIRPERRERLHHVISHRGKNARKEGATLMIQLDKRYCRQTDGDFELDETTRGVLYNFRHEPTFANLAEAIEAANGDDVIFSVEPGKLAVHVSHEGWSWLCRR